MPAQGLGERLSAEAFGQAERLPVRLVLDNIRSGQNVGACFRSADAFRIDGLDLCGITCHPPHRDILKSALGASGHVPWNAHAETLSAVQHLQSQGWKVAAVEQAPTVWPCRSGSPLRTNDGPWSLATRSGECRRTFCRRVTLWWRCRNTGSSRASTSACVQESTCGKPRSTCVTVDRPHLGPLTLAQQKAPPIGGAFSF